MFEARGEHSVKFEVWDHDTFSADDLIGDGMIAAAQFNVKLTNQAKEGTVDCHLNYKGRPAGVLQVKYIFEGENPAAKQG